MSIPNPIYRYLWNLFDRLRKRKTEKDLEEAHNIAHHLLTAAKDSAVTLRNASLVFGAMARKENDLGKYELCGKMVAHAEALEAAVKMGGGYMKYPDAQ